MFAWSDIVKELDHPGFQITTKAGLSTLIQGIVAFPGNAFQITHLYTLWRNKEGQVML